MSLRLTKDVRNDIHYTVMEKAFPKERAELAKKDAALANTILELRRAAFLRAFNGKVADIAKLPKYYTLKVQGIELRIPGLYYNSRKFKLSESILMPLCEGSRRIYSNYLELTTEDLPKPLQTVLKAHNKDWKAFRDKLDEFDQSVRGILNSATTLKKLKEVWPEGVKYFPSEADGMTTALVAIEKIEAVNTAFGLKPSPAREPVAKAPTQGSIQGRPVGSGKSSSPKARAKAKG